MHEPPALRKHPCGLQCANVAAASALRVSHARGDDNRMRFDTDSHVTARARRAAHNHQIVHIASRWCAAHHIARSRRELKRNDLQPNIDTNDAGPNPARNGDATMGWMLDRVGRSIARYLERPAPGYEPFTPSDPDA